MTTTFDALSRAGRGRWRTASARGSATRSCSTATRTTWCRCRRPAGAPRAIGRLRAAGDVPRPTGSSASATWSSSTSAPTARSSTRASRTSTSPTRWPSSTPCTAPTSRRSLPREPVAFFSLLDSFLKQVVAPPAAARRGGDLPLRRDADSRIGRRVERRRPRGARVHPEVVDRSGAAGGQRHRSC